MHTAPLSPHFEVYPRYLAASHDQKKFDDFRKLNKLFGNCCKGVHDRRQTDTTTLLALQQHFDLAGIFPQ